MSESAKPAPERDRRDESSATAAAIRPLAPSGAPGVGDPPVAVAALVAVRPRPGEDRVAAALRRHPDLSKTELHAAFELLDREGPDALTPKLSGKDSLGLAVPSGLAVLFGASGLALLASVVAGTFILHLLGYGDAPQVMPGVARPQTQQLFGSGLVGLLLLGLGWGLRGLHREVRTGVTLLALIGLVGSVIGGVGFAGALCLCALLVWLPQVRPWFEPDGRAAARAAPLVAYTNAVAWGAVTVGALLAIVPRFKELFANVGMSLPWGTMLVLEAADFAANYSLLLPPLLLFAPLPLLRVDGSKRRAAALATHVVGVAALGSIVGWMIVPVLQLIERL